MSMNEKESLFSKPFRNIILEIFKSLVAILIMAIPVYFIIKLSNNKYFSIAFSILVFVFGYLLIMYLLRSKVLIRIKDKILGDKKPNAYCDENRTVSLDILRIFSILMIFLYNALINSNIITTNFNVSGILHNSYLAVGFAGFNIFVLVSSYYLLDSNKVRWIKLVQMILELWIINFIVGISYKAIFNVSMRRMDYIYLLFPFLSKQNWLINIYLILYLLHPFINKLLKSLKNRDLTILTVILLFFFCIVPSILPIREWSYDLTGGYSIVWFITLYVLTAFIKRFEKKKLFNLDAIVYLCGFILASIAIVGSKYLLNFLVQHYNLANYQSVIYLWYQNDTIMVLIAALCLFLMFKNINITKSNIITRIIKVLSSATFGIYIIHDNFLVRKHFFTEVINLSKYTNSMALIFIILGLGIGVIIVGSLLYYYLNNLSYLVSYFFVKEKTWSLDDEEKETLDQEIDNKIDEEESNE